MAQGLPDRRKGGREAEEMRSARRQARHSVRIALRRLGEYHEAGAFVTPTDLAGLLLVLTRADHHLSTMEDHYG